MNKDQLKQVMGYLDMEYSAIISKMTAEERKMRFQHWAKEIGPLDFTAVMTAVRKLSQGQYMPRTGEVIAEIGKITNAAKPQRSVTCHIYRDAAGNEILDLHHSDGSLCMTGYLDGFPEWMQVKFRWMADPTPANTEAWDNYIMAHDRHDKYSYPGMFPEADMIMESI